MHAHTRAHTPALCTHTTQRPPTQIRAAWQVERPSDIASASKLVFPGVGSFGQAAAVLRQRGYVEPLVEYIQVGPCMLHV